jgi:beta-glucuronidase
MYKQSGGEVLPMPVPSSYNDVTTEKDVRDFVGWAWYERHFFAPIAWTTSGVRVMLRFGSVHYAAKVVSINMSNMK